jgi:peroxiredoxin
MISATEETLLLKTRRSPAFLVGAICALAAFTVFITWRAARLEITLQEESEQPALVSRMAPDFSGSTLDGRTVSLSDFRGQKEIVVAFWASWCGPCRLEMPELKKFYRRYHKQSSDFEVLAVSIDSDAKDTEAFVNAEKLEFPVVLDNRQRMADSYGVEMIPTMFIIDKSGKVVFGHSGYNGGMRYWLAARLGVTDDNRAGGSDDSGD